MTQDPYRYFRAEARDLVDQVAKGVLDLEKDGGDVAAVQRLLRVAHTLKGAARVVKRSEIADRAHAIEDTLSPYRDAATGMAREQIDAVLAHLDEISRELASLGKPQPQATERPAGKKAEVEEAPRTVRADIAEADAVLEGVAETHALLNKLRTTAEGMEQARDLAELLLAQLGARGADHSRSSSRVQSTRTAIAEDLCRKFGGVERGLGSVIDQMDRELMQLREAAERMRLVAAGSLFTALERTARDAARSLGKQVTFESKGGDIRLDAHVLETVQGALIQMIRNAVAHGIETENERTVAGKPRAGSVSMHVSRRGRRIVFACRDDGRGVDLEAVRQAAQRRGLLDGPGKASQGKDAQALMRMLLHGGISTSKTVTDVSGRGVGLDVVREAVERLGGEVNFHTERGAGTTVELVIPPSLASIEVLLLETQGAGGSSVISIPLDAVRSTLRVPASEISCGSPGASVLYGGQAIPFVPLVSALDRTGWSATRGWTAVVVSGAQGLAAIGVDRMLGTRRVVARPLPESMSASPLVVGASLDADGNPQLVLDPDCLVAAAQRGESTADDAVSSAKPVLVIDDSLTTRMLEQSILESAGYPVDVAASAEEGLEVLRTKRFALILVDVEMPGMDGFTFIERIKADAALRDIPAILVTSRASPEDLQRGRDVGAHAHIVKSEFDQAELLSLIQPFAS